MQLFINSYYSNAAAVLKSLDDIHMPLATGDLYEELLSDKSFDDLLCCNSIAIKWYSSEKP